MAFIPVPNVAHIRVEGSVDRQQTINDLYFEISGGGITSVNLASLVSAMDLWAGNQLAPQLSRDWGYLRTTGRDLTTVNGAVSEASTPAEGGVDEEAAPNNVAACISLKSGVSGRSFRGRNYIPALPNSLIELNTITGPLLSSLQLAYDALVGPGGFLAGWQLVVVSRFSGVDIDGRPIPRVSGIATPVEQAVFTSPFVKSMRSREIGHGK